MPLLECKLSRRNGATAHEERKKVLQRDNIRECEWHDSGSGGSGGDSGGGSGGCSGSGCSGSGGSGGSGGGSGGSGGSCSGSGCSGSGGSGGGQVIHKGLFLVAEYSEAH